MSEIRPTRIRIAFEKGPEMRFTGHLDLQRAWERTIRRARLPVVYSQGFNPRPKMQLGPALPLGCTSVCELIDVWLNQEFEAHVLLEKLRSASPPGIVVQAVSEIAAGEAALQNRVVAVEYEATLAGAGQLNELRLVIESFLGQTSAIRIRRGKEYDLRPLVESLDVCSADQENAGILKMRLASQEGATGRPEELLLALGLDPTQIQIARTRLIFDNQI